MRKFLLLFLVLVNVNLALAQNPNFRFLERNSKLHRTQAKKYSPHLVIGQTPVAADTLSISELLPGKDPGVVYGALRKDLDLQVRSSSLYWRYRNYKHGAPNKAQYKIPKIKLIPDSDRLSYPRKRNFKD